MESLPLETLQRIFELACTDGGFTGNSLSGASKHIRAAARRHRFHTLHLVAESRGFAKFIALYKHVWDDGGDNRPCVRHLHLTLFKDPTYLECTGIGIPTPSVEPRRPHTPCKRFSVARIVKTGAKVMKKVAKSISRGRSPAHPLISHTPSEEEVSTPAPSYNEIVVRELVRIVAPDLWSLVVNAGPSLRFIIMALRLPVLDNRFPLVREATFVGQVDPSQLLLTAADPSLAFPVATHLNLVSYYQELHLRSWSGVAPNVTHLRVSGISWTEVKHLAEAVGVHVDLEPLVAPTPDNPLALAPRPRTYPSVRYLLMEPESPKLPYSSCCHCFRKVHALGRITFECDRELGGSVVAAVRLPKPDGTSAWWRWGDVPPEKWIEVEQIEGEEDRW